MGCRTFEQTFGLFDQRQHSFCWQGLVKLVQYGGMKVQVAMRLKSFHVRAGLLIALLAMSGCGKKPPSARPEASLEPESTNGKADPEPIHVINVEELPAVFQGVIGSPVVPNGMIAIPELRLHAKPGQDVIFEAKVMGSSEPFVKNRASMIVGDENTVASCDLLGLDERCPTPWDVHHEDLEAVKSGTAVIQIVDDNRKVVKTGLRGAAGLKELSRLRISGTVAPESTGETLIINASAIQIIQ